MGIIGFLAVSPWLNAGTPQEVVLQPDTAPTDTVIIPDHFLRRWDPVTIFFTRDTGPDEGGPEDRPQRFVTMDPEHPGAFTWLDSRTLQFRPAEPWPSLAQFQWTTEETTVELTTLMATPVTTFPADKSEGIDTVKEITLTFAEPLDTDALSRMLSIELRPLPGVSSDESRWLTGSDFQIKTRERRSRQDPASYVLALKEPIPLGTHVLVHFRLSLDTQDSQSFYEISFSTAEPFRATAMGCREKRYPLTANGSHYTREQVLNCSRDPQVFLVEFSANPADLDIVVGRNLIRFTPAVPDLKFSPQGRTLEIRGDFKWDTLYRVDLVPIALKDIHDRTLKMDGTSEVYIYFPRKPAYVKWSASRGIVERYGEKHVPIEGRGQERLDLRIYPIDPLDRSFWPFPDSPVGVNESLRPPGPGEEPRDFVDTDRSINTSELTGQLSALGSPPVSEIIDLPLRREGSAASFGLDLSPLLARIRDPEQPGAYLVGIRDLGGSQIRYWMRLQSTDLSLSTIEEFRTVRFVVTSLSNGTPVASAQIRLEGTRNDNGKRSWTTLAEGRTDVDGIFRWEAPGYIQNIYRTIRRITVQNQDDILVLDPARPPDRYQDNQWSSDRSQWLQWTMQNLENREPPAVVLAHIFTERPVYKPEESVHIKGYLRQSEHGKLTPVALEGWLVVEGPGDLAWKYPVSVSPIGNFYFEFKEKDLPTGTYSAHIESQDRKERHGNVSFQIEAYRIPRFEVTLHGPQQAALDKEFSVSLTAEYYAGGRVGGQPIHWRVSQFPYTWNPKARPGFLFSTDARFSSGQEFQSTPRLEKDDVTDETGSASIILNPAIEPTAQPRSYVIEATVTGPDDQTVTATRTIPALPQFVLGLKAPRFLEQATEIEPEIIVVGPDDLLMAQKELTVRLLRREWHSVLRVSDFSDGVARYLTDVVDVKVSETKVMSSDDPVKVRLPIDKAGVYIVEVEARDQLDRAQVVRADLYAGGDQPVAWPKPVTRVFTVSTDRTDYDPGTMAAILLQSPFQNARALAIIEAPEGNRYEWIQIEGGSATFHVPVEGHFTPRLPVHFILMRGRVPGTGPQPGNTTDLGKPATMAATAWLKVNPVANRVNIDLKYRDTAQPGSRIQMEITLTDPNGQPQSGEVTLWLVDQAVLALGKEQRLDPVPDFLHPVRSHLVVHDTRNMPFGLIPFAEKPGGGQPAEEEPGLLDRATIRKNFKTVPYYNPAISVGPDGRATVTIQLSDDLTNFKIRAKASSGPDRFGFATGTIRVRLPVIVQPALPRFVRPGDRFDAVAIGRIVEGSGGPGTAEISVEGVELSGPSRKELTWVEGKPEQITFPVEVSTPSPKGSFEESIQEVSFRIAVERISDMASDAFEVKLPVLPDREKTVLRSLTELGAGNPVQIEAIPEKIRSGSLRRSILISDQPALVRMAAGLSFMLEYPYGCTEQQISRARVFIALRNFRTLLNQSEPDSGTEKAVEDTLQWISSAIDRNGLVAYWPGSDGYVSLTSWVVQFMLEARDAGFTVDNRLLDKLLQTLEQALRSDYSRFISGESFTERTWALAALAHAGRFNGAYAAELARRAQYLNLESIAQILQAFAAADELPADSTIDQLSQELWNGMIIRLYQGAERYGGLQEGRLSTTGLILPTETRTVAEITRAILKIQPKNPRLPLLVNALVTLGKDDGWGTTNANAAALTALSDLLTPPFPGSVSRTVRLRAGDVVQDINLGPEAPLRSVSIASGEEGEVALEAGPDTPRIAVRIDTSYLPEADGSHAVSKSQGFVVSRELLRLGKPDEPAVKLPISDPGTVQTFTVGQVVEEHIQVVNPKDRNYVAVVIPLAAGMEPLNPNLATAPPEASPSGRLTRASSYNAFLDDHVAFYYDSLTAGTYDFYFRTRASTSGSFIQPPAKAEMMYDANIRGNSPGARINVE
jgi:uncharacterized protein YfaS (alpha-2-macroglobulin family)